MKKITDAFNNIKKQLENIENLVSNTVELASLKIMQLENYDRKEIYDFKIYANGWDKKLRCDQNQLKAEIQEVMNKYEAIHSRNLDIIASNQIVLKKIHDFMVGLGLHDTKTITQGSGKRSHFATVDADWWSSIKQNVPTCDKQYDDIKRIRDSRISEIGYFLDNERKKAREQQDRLEKESIVIESVKYITEKGEDVPLDLTKVTGRAIEIRVKELIAESEGTEIEIKCCDSCNTWVAGENRCSCGNRRMGWSWGGTSFKDVYVYPEAN